MILTFDFLHSLKALVGVFSALVIFHNALICVSLLQVIPLASVRQAGSPSTCIRTSARQPAKLTLIADSLVCSSDSVEVCETIEMRLLLPHRQQWALFVTCWQGIW